MEATVHRFAQSSINASWKMSRPMRWATKRSAFVLGSDRIFYAKTVERLCRKRARELEYPPPVECNADACIAKAATAPGPDSSANGARAGAKGWRQWAKYATC